MQNIILNKILLGISLAAPIGPLNAEMIKRGLTNGFWAAFSVRLGGSISNSIFLLIIYFGLEQLVKMPALIFSIHAVGEIVLIYMGITTIIKTYSTTSITKIKFTKKFNNNYNITQGILTGIILSATSPIAIMFWLTSFPVSVSNDKSSLAINFFVIFGATFWGGLISCLLHFSSKIINAVTLRIVSVLSGLILIYFGIKYSIYTLTHM